ncbi:MAG: DUF4350 domain-containing protein [Janthinobacterium lividum]
MTTLRWYLLGLLALFGVYVALEYYRPKPIDWTPSLINKDKIPYGTYALYDVLPTLLGTDSVESVRLPIYNQFYDADDPTLTETEADTTASTDTSARSDTTRAGLAETATADTVAEAATAPAADSTAEAAPALTDSTTATADSLSEDDEEEYVDPVIQRRASYLFVEPEFASTAPENDALMRFAAAGNDVFIVADEYAQGNPLRRRRTLPEQLGVVVKHGPLAIPNPAKRQQVDSVRFNFVNPALAGAAIQLPAYQSTTYFEVKPGLTGTTLATNEQGQAVLIRLDYGRGHFYLCSVPLAFTNYYVLPPSSRRFALAALSYLPTGRPVWWDEYQKQGRTSEQSVLRLVMAHDALRWAYYLLTITVILLVLVEARRRQRVIPTLKPLPNTTLLFTRTVASLYQKGSNHSRIAEKKVALFLDYLRTRFHEPAPELASEEFRERLSQKTGLTRPRVDELVRLINHARTAPTVTDQQLLILSRAIRDFKREVR